MEILIFLAVVIGVAITAAIVTVSGVLSSVFAAIAEEDDAEE